ncbi:MAG: nuclear transport factor 2 family protein [Sciscionella sp.]
MTVPVADVQDVADRLAVRALLSRYTQACDRKDWELLDTCFLPDAAIDYQGLPPFSDGYAGLRANTVRVLGQLRSTQHLLGNLHVEIDGDEGRAVSYVQATHLGTDGRVFVTGGRYDDRLVRTPQGWRIAARTFRRQWGTDPDGLGASLKGAPRPS